jgi:D-alanine-D-alanine ligase
MEKKLRVALLFGGRSAEHASAAAMDKDAAKRLLRDAGLPIVRFRAVTEADGPSFAELVTELGRPLFVKPARLGSSVGVGKADTAEEFAAALREARFYFVCFLLAI